jgi:hypothetical protein
VKSKIRAPGAVPLPPHDPAAFKILNVGEFQDLKVGFSFSEKNPMLQSSNLLNNLAQTAMLAQEASYAKTP